MTKLILKSALTCPVSGRIEVLQYESDKSFVVARWDSRSGELDALVIGHPLGNFEFPAVP